MEIELAELLIIQLLASNFFAVYKKTSFNLAFSAGIELPTGVQKGSSFDETTVVVGSGSFDPMAGFSFAKGWNKLTLQGNALYRHTTKGFDNTTFSSVSFQNLTVAYSIKGHSAACQQDSVCQQHTSGWSVFGGYYGEYLSKIIEGDGEEDVNSGYYAGFATIGTNISAKGWSIPVTFSYPLIQHVNGDQNNAGYRMRVEIVKKI